MATPIDDSSDAKNQNFDGSRGSSRADTTVGDLDRLYRQARTARARLEPVWYLNLAYYANEQWLAWDGRQLYRPTLRPNRITIIDNRVTPIIRKEVARMTKNKPVFVVSPQTGDETDLHAAELAENLMRYMWRHLKMEEIARKALLWSRICGAGFLKTMWDPSVGSRRDVYVGPDGQILTDASGAPVDPGQVPSLPGVRRQTVAEGDVKVEARSPFQIFVDPLADSFHEAEWLVEESIKSAGYIKQRYQVSVEPDTPANPGMIEARMGAVFMPGTGGYKGVKVREYWCRPCDEHPQGYRAVWAQGKILFADNKPFDPFPYVMLKGIDVPGRLWPASVVELLRGPQTELNKVRSQIAENRNRVGNPTILASKQAVQDPEKFALSTTMPGGIYFFDDVGSPNAVPTYLQAPPLPDYVLEEIPTIQDSMQEISGQHEVTSAQVPPGVTAASAINLLQESDDTMLGPSIHDYESAIGDLGQKVLKHVANFFTDERTIRLAGDNGAWQIFPFRGAMLKDNTHVEVQAGSAFPQSKAAKQAAMQDLLTFFVQSGNPPHGRQLAQFLEDWEVGGADRLIQDYTRDETQVNAENMKLAQGMMVELNPYDDDQAHIDGHTDFQKQVQYTGLPPQMQATFEAHVDAHRQRQEADQKQQMEVQMELQGLIPPNLTAPAYQAAQQLSQGLDQQSVQQLQQQQLQQQGAQFQVQHQGMQQQNVAQGQQQGFDAAAQQQQQRHAEESHQQQLRQAEELHQAKIIQMGQQNQQQAPQPSKGAVNGGK